MKTTKIDAAKLSQDEKIGVMERCIIGAIHAMACDGAPLDTILEMKEIITSLSSTIWSVCALKSCGIKTDKLNKEYINIQLKQFEGLIVEVRELFEFCDKVRDKNNLKVN